MEQDTRIESDALGEIAVPASAYWGAQTQRSLENFPFAPRERMPVPIVRGLVLVKRAAAAVHLRSGALSEEIATAITDAADRVLDGQFADQFPLTIWQTGSGTQTNMNVNEVLAGIANEALTGRRGGKTPVHPNDHVNKGQSSNDSFPTAIHVGVAIETKRRMLPALETLSDALVAKAKAWTDIVKIGRTHFQDATPLTLGQEFSGYAAQLIASKRRIEAAIDHNVCDLPQGGTAVGTGLNAPKGFAEDMAKELSYLTGIDFTPARNAFAGNASSDGLVFFAGAMTTLATALNKIANDIRMLGSGPRAGLGELSLPENEPGSSIMPGKVNPTQCEMMTMVAAQVIADGQAAAMGNMQGQFELNTFRPMIGANVLRSVDLLASGMDSFAKRCVEGLEPNRKRITELVESSLMLVTALAPEIGYDKASHIAHEAHESGRSLRDVAIEQGVSPDDYDRIVRPEKMV